MKLFITGAGGLLGSRVAEIAVEKGYTVYSAYLTHLPSVGHPIRVDVTDKERVSKVIGSTKPDVIIHCAALTNVDLCEMERELALRVNVEGAKNIAEAAKENNAHLVYISTDYVFDGEKGLYSEKDDPNPINFYGYSKLLGEKAVMETSKEFLIVRASVIFGAKPAAGKTNFALWVLENLKANREIKVLIDQYVSPTLNTNLAEMILDACERRLTGLYHMAGRSRVSRYEFAVKLARVFDLDEDLIRKACMHEMRWKARRPRDSSLDVSRAMRSLRVKPLSLSEALNVLREELGLSK